MIHFVGAGPGAVDLITLRGAKLLREADVVIYAGSLVSPALLQDVRPETEVYDSAKMTLPELVDVMRCAHEAGKTVVRLHTGDPSLYGAWKEQADALSALDIPYDVTPGVSSFCAAAAALKAEYTLPGVSQSLVVTRAQGKTGVPEREALAQWAAAGASMAVFLSAAEAGQVQRELLRGAYTEDTPCAVVYRASWEDERVFRCTLGTLEQTVREAGIDRHALILVGGFLDSAYETSRLYDPAFETAHRKKHTGMEEPVPESVNDIAYLAFTEQGEALAHRICGALGGTVVSRADGMTADAFAREAFEQHRAIVFVSALGIAVRAVAPYLKGKTKDPAVAVIDEKAGHVIPVVSGHLGGANALARRIAAVTGADCVITTATDVNHVFAVDEWARVQGFHVHNPEKIRQVSGKLLAGETVKVFSRFPVDGAVPQGVSLNHGNEGFDVVLDVRADCSDALLLVPKVLVLGCGTKKGIAKETIVERFASFVKKHQVSEAAIACVATIDLKKEEPGLLAFCEAHGFALRSFSAKELAGTGGAFTGSSFVEEQTGVDNVCERSAVLASGGSLVVKKDAGDGVTFALAMMPFCADWKWTDDEA